ncbi:MAG: aminomethyltransferase family protein [Dehalococcoidia bacterium]|nr:aminomethyltransferase family protein [Dehalococcoidia bacterium]
MEPSRSPIHDAASGSGASFVEREPWPLVSSFGDVASEYEASRSSASLYDSSHLGRISATGADVLDLLNRLSTNMVESIEVGSGARTVLTDERGRILDHLQVFNMGSWTMLIVGPHNRERVMEWIDKFTIVDDVETEDITLSTAMFTILGPQAREKLSSLAGERVGGLEPCNWTAASIQGAGMQVLRTDGAGDPTYEVIARAEDAPTLWLAIRDAGITPIGSDAFEALRIEGCIPGPEAELTDAYNPLEAGLWDSISFNKGCYIGQEVIARLDTYGKVQRHLVSIGFPESAHVECGSKLSYEGREVGSVTSVAQVPGRDGLLALGYVRKESATPGTKLTLASDPAAKAEVLTTASGTQPEAESQVAI